MAQYEEYLMRLLAPLGVYDLTAGTANESELYALGAALDALNGQLESVQREALTATAEGEGLARRESLFARVPAAPTTALRRAAITALTRIDGDSLTEDAINRAIGGCGIRARAEAAAQPGTLRVRFPDVAGVPEGFARIREIILDILPCHLETEFHFRYLTWAECEAQEMTWASIETAEHTWESLMLAVRSLEE